MECNKDEAVRAKEIAEKKFLEKDIAGARKFALKAQNLYPGLEGISQMIATLDVFIAAENKINGEGNWYGILGVTPSADEENIRKQFRKLALMFHPDKNKTVGAEGAFKLISEAWSLLSDKSKKLAYDQRNASVLFQNGGAKVGPSPPSVQGGFYDFAKGRASHKKPPKNTNKVAPSTASASSHMQEKSTFWTACHRCKMQYEYLRMYRNQNLLCPNCHEAFFAAEIPPPSSNGSRMARESNYSQQQNLHQHVMRKKSSNTVKRNSGTPNVGYSGLNSNDFSNYNNFQWVPFSKTSGAASAVQAATMVQQAYEKVKRERQEAEAATKREAALRKKNCGSKRARHVSPSGYPDNVKRKRGLEDCGTRSNMKRMNTGSGMGCTVTLSEIRNSNDIICIDIKQLLMDKARKDIYMRLDKRKAAESAAKSEMNVNEKSNGKENRRNCVAVSLACDKNNSCDKVDTGFEVSASMYRCVADGLTNRFQKQLLEKFSIDVPDADFHDFDRDRLEMCFKDNQVWSAYDVNDGMPRCYAMVHRVVSLTPFKMQITWLHSETNGKLGSLTHMGSGFSRACGDFKLGRHEIRESLNFFSHNVKWTKATCGAIQILPKKGDVWALYRNWSAEWNELTEDEVICRYDMVEVLEGYDEGEGVIVIPLVKVAGFRTVFHRHLDPRKIRKIPSEEICRFSHHVPSYALTGKEGTNAPKGCLELDPAAIPSDLLEVFMNIQEESIVDGVGEDENEIEKISHEGKEELPGSSREMKPFLEDKRNIKEGDVVNSEIIFEDKQKIEEEDVVSSVR